MRIVTDNFKIDLRTYGRQLDAKVKINDDDFDPDNLNYIKPSFNTSLFKTIMHLVEIDSKVLMIADTKISITLGVKLNEKSYEYIDLGTYYVKTCERQEDTNSYRIMAYTKMKDAMIDYDLSIMEKIPTRDYLIRICQRLGWNTDNIPATFINSKKSIDPTLHIGIGYTFRDALDEIATITCSFLLFKDDSFYLKYLTEVDADIDESYLDEDNITIGEKYIINSLVFSRAEESDNIYRKDDTSIATNGLHEYRISDCQLLSTNDRSDYIDEMFNYLKSLEFYIFDIQSKGILFLEACDMFNLVLNGVIYKTILLNDEINIEDGLKEKLYIDEPEETQTEYKYADSKDKKINQTYILVDKQNQVIESVVSNVDEQNQKVAKVTQTVEELNSKISDIADITTSKESLNGSVNFEKINQSEPIRIEIYPTTENISFLYPSGGLYPSDKLYPKVRILRFLNTTTKEYFDYELPDDLLRCGDVYDEFILDYDALSCVINKRVGYNADGTTYVLDAETTTEYDFPHISLTDGDYVVSLIGYEGAYLFVRLMSQNIYTTQFATKAEVNSEIIQKANEITTNVNSTFATKGELTTAKSEIKQTTDSISSEVSKKVNDSELGTKIQQNVDSVKVAWNQISEFIQMMIINGNASLAILDSNKNILMALDKTGQHFYDSNKNIFAEMGIESVDNQSYIAFSVLGDYNKEISNGMAWGIKTSTDNKFYPILFIKNFGMGNKESDDHYGQLVLSSCDLVLGGMETGVVSGNARMYGNVFSGLTFEDINSGEELFAIYPKNSNLSGALGGGMKILDNISFYKNSVGSNSFMIGDNKYVLVTDKGDLHVINGSVLFGTADKPTTFDVYVPTLASIHGNLDVSGNVYANNLSSDRRIKNNIKNSETNALDIIKQIQHKQFDKKDDGKHYDIGYIAQEMEKIDSNFVIIRPKTEKTEERYYINELPIIATATKAIQEQQEQIEALQEKDKQKDELIQSLIQRIENLERRVANGDN